MGLFGCCGKTMARPSAVFAALSRAAAKSAASRLRGAGLLRVHPGAARRLAVCQRCPLRVMRGDVAWCGTPLLERPAGRWPEAGGRQGCGCPLAAKAQSPAEHCPLDAAGRPGGGPADVGAAGTGAAAECSCLWCEAERGR